MKIEEIERSIIKTYRKELWGRFVKGVKEFDMIKEGDSVACCISGGKDSVMLAKLLQELKKHGDVNFDLKFIVMDPGYNSENLELIKENAKHLEIDIHIFNSDIFDVVENVTSPCYLCARMRRGYLYNEAKNLGCNKIALGHHFDDIVETILMSTLYGAEYKTMMPKLHSTNFEEMELIRPMYYVREKDIIAWVDYCGLKFLNCACKASSRETSSKRKEIKELIKSLKLVNKNVDINILRSSFNVNLNTIIGYNKDELKYSFMDDYEEEV